MAKRSKNIPHNYGANNQQHAYTIGKDLSVFVTVIVRFSKDLGIWSTALQ